MLQLLERQEPEGLQIDDAVHDFGQSVLAPHLQHGQGSQGGKTARPVLQGGDSQVQGLEVCQLVQRQKCVQRRLHACIPSNTCLEGISLFGITSNTALE